MVRVFLVPGAAARRLDVLRLRGGVRKEEGGVRWRFKTPGCLSWVYFGREEGVQRCDEERPTWLLFLRVKKLNRIRTERDHDAATATRAARKHRWDLNPVSGRRTTPSLHLSRTHTRAHTVQHYYRRLCCATLLSRRDYCLFHSTGVETNILHYLNFEEFRVAYSRFRVSRNCPYSSHTVTSPPRVWRHIYQILAGPVEPQLLVFQAYIYLSPPRVKSVQITHHAALL